MNMRFLVSALVLFATSMVSGAQMASHSPTLSAEVRRYLKVDEQELRLAHVKVIDGTGNDAVDDQTVVIRQGRIDWVGRDDRLPRHYRKLPELDLSGHTVFPGIVGMHNHLFYAASLDYDEHFNLPAPGPLVNQIAFSAPRLYLAAGVTTIRTAGSMEPYTDINLRAQVQAGAMPGPDMDVTGPYLQGPGGSFSQMHSLRDVEDTRETVAFWAKQGATSFKAYTNITRAQLTAAIEETHRRGLKITGHLCSVSYREAASLGIDNLEHGPIYSDSGFVPERSPDVCPSSSAVSASWLNRDIAAAEVSELIRHLVSHNVAITSTLPVSELRLPGRPPLPQRFLEAMSPPARESYLAIRARVPPSSPNAATLFEKEMQFELAFARAGGVLLAGPDPTGIGGVLPGFGDQRGIELLVEAGFTPVEAIRIATANGARYLGKLDEMGTVTAGKRANLVVVKGDPARRIADIENVEIVFKDGLGFDSKALIDSVRGSVGIR